MNVSPQRRREILRELIYQSVAEQEARRMRVRVTQNQADQLIERIRNEGANSPADVFITVDAARLARAASAGILTPLRSAVIEQRILDGLRNELDTTTLVVAHRVATIRLADRVLFLDRGVLVGDGTHDELLAYPQYAALVRAYEQAATGPDA